MKSRAWLGSTLLLLALLVIAIGLAAWKRDSLAEADAAAASQPEPTEVVTAAVATVREHLRTSTSIGTVMALRSITLRNELPGKVVQVALVPGQVVETGALLVAQDVTVEAAELKAQQAQVALSETILGRLERASKNRGASEVEVDRARAERDIALAQVARIQALIDRKTLRAPFRARIGLSDVHEGQYLDEGTELTTLQGVDDAVNVDFSVSQQVAAGLAEGDRVEVAARSEGPTTPGTIVALDSRVDPRTRNAWVRARVEGAGDAPAPGASVRVIVPVGAAQSAVAVPVTALRKGSDGAHVFVLAADEQGRLRARLRQVESGAILGDEVLVLSGLQPGEQVAAAGSFKLRDGVLVALAEPAGATP
jgi:membrane fusion protein, multidrug efflux system